MQSDLNVKNLKLTVIKLSKTLQSPPNGTGKVHMAALCFPLSVSSVH